MGLWACASLSFSWQEKRSALLAKTQASGCAHVCCRAAWVKLGLKNGFLRLDGEEQLVLTDVAKEVESDPEVETSDVDEGELHLSEPYPFPG